MASGVENQLGLDRISRCPHVKVLYSWVWFEPTKGTPLPPSRGSRPVFFALPVLSVPLVPVHRLCLGRGDQIVPRKCALKGGHRTPNPLSILAELTWNAQIWRIAERLVP